MKKCLVLSCLLIVIFSTACQPTETPQEILQNNEALLTAPAMAVTITRQDCPAIEAAVGTQVMWTNADTVALSLKLEELDEYGDAINSETSELQPGDSFSRVFPEPVTYRYSCSEEMDGYRLITVK